jgi:ribosomal protein S18 acetylase RimI-like enzyme
MSLQVRRLGADDLAVVLSIGHLLDGPVREDAARRFLASPTNHLLVAFVDGQPAGFISGVELTHPDKGTEMFLYELGVDEAFRRRGIGRQLTEALASLAQERGCYDMWVGTEPDNVAALATYRSAGATSSDPFCRAHLGLRPGGGVALARGARDGSQRMTGA